jgi:hypothetical protein
VTLLFAPQLLGNVAATALLLAFVALASGAMVLIRRRGKGGA